MSDDNSSDNTAPDDKGSGDGAPDKSLEKGPDNNAFKPITSQEEFDAILNKRIERAKRSTESKYEGFDELKEKASKYDQLEASQGSEIEKAMRRAEKAEKERDSYKEKLSAADRRDMVRDIADELGLPKKLASRVQGATEEEIRADIADLIDGLPKPKGDDDSDKSKDDKKEPPSQQPRRKMTFTASGDEADEGLNVTADDILKDITRGGGH